MEKLQFTIKINAPVNKVYDLMLGINNKSTYEQWTAMFNPTSTFEGNWDKGSKRLIVGVDEKVEKGGLIVFIPHRQSYITRHNKFNINLC